MGKWVLLTNLGQTVVTCCPIVWSRALQLAMRWGWHPRGTAPPLAPSTATEPMGEKAEPCWNGRYSQPCGQYVLAADAARLAYALERALDMPHCRWPRHRATAQRRRYRDGVRWHRRRQRPDTIIRGHGLLGRRRLKSLDMNGDSAFTRPPCARIVLQPYAITGPLRETLHAIIALAHEGGFSIEREVK